MAFANFITQTASVQPSSGQPMQLSTIPQPPTGQPTNGGQPLGTTPSSPAQATPSTNVQSAAMAQHTSSPDLYAFLVAEASSIFARSYRVAQTPVWSSLNQSITSMSNDDFFDWIRTEFYSCKGLLASWLSVRIYSHCEFFEVRLH
jgi:hypothetical protein